MATVFEASYEELQELRAEITRLRAERDSLRTRANLAEGERDALDRSHRDLAKRLADAQRANEQNGRK